MNQIEAIEVAIQKVRHNDISQVRARNLGDGSYLVHFVVRVKENEKEEDE